MEPGDALASALLNGQINGAQLGQAIFNLLPALPWEGPPLPRVLVSRISRTPATLPVPTPQVLQAAAAAPAVVPPAAPVVQVQPAAVVIPVVQGMQFRGPVVTGIHHPPQMRGV